MKKKLLALLLGVAMVSTLFVGCGAKEEAAEAPAEAPAEVVTETEAPAEEAEFEFDEATITVSYHSAETSQYGKGLALFKELVEEKTGGKVTVDVYYNGTLYGQQTEYEALQKGEVDLILGSLNSAMEYIPELRTTFCPFLWKSPDHYNAFWEGEVGKGFIQQIADELGTYYLGFGNSGSRHIELAIDKQITCCDDMKDIKLRTATAENMIAMVDALGANPVPVAFADTYLALETGLAQGLEGDIPGLYANGFDEVLKSITITAHAYSLDGFVASAVNWDKWQPELQAVVKESIVEVTDFVNNLTAEEEAAAAERLEADGIKVYTLSDEVLDAYREEVMAAFLASDYAADYDMELFEAIKEMGKDF